MTREEQLDWLCRLKSEIYVYMPKEWLIPMNNALDMAIKEITPIRPKGHWIKQTLSVKPFGEDTVLCDQCAFMTDKDSEYRYCPNCGAKMESEVEK